MNRDEFTAVSALLTAAVGKPMPRQQLEVYFDLLADLPGNVVLAAAQQAILENQYPTIPPVGVLRRLATAALAPPECSAYEAWEVALNAVRRFGLDGEAEALRRLAPGIARAAKAIGWRALCDSSPSAADTLRAQFRQAYETIADRARHERILPRHLRAALAQLAQEVPAYRTIGYTDPDGTPDEEFA